MRLYSTNNKQSFATLREALFRGLPEDNGLYMPEVIPVLPDSFIRELPDLSFQDIAFRVAAALFMGEIPDADLRAIVERAIDFPAPVVTLEHQIRILELFHGPSLAFKDFGARFMANLMGYYNQGESRELVVLVATSGDTGGAVAAGFHKTPGIRVVILYPQGKVSMLQEKQLTTLGHNVTALEVNGTFDDCQAMVKRAFLDEELRAQLRLSSANSINIARLIPQSFYYFEAFKQVQPGSKVVFVVPSGNFGNLTAGLLARRMGLPVHHFVAATNLNDVVPAYLSSGQYHPRPSIRTLSNAMDVGNPSNFARMLDLYCSTWNMMREDISGWGFDDRATETAIRELYSQYGYVADPHGAVGYLALKTYLSEHPDPELVGIILETAHPAKFLDDVEQILGRKIPIPPGLADLADKAKISVKMEPKFDQLKTWLLQNC